MRRRRIASTVLLAIAIVSVAAAPVPALPDAAREHAPHYYLALGDSLSRGVQVGPEGVSVPTDEGYTDQLHARLAEDRPNLRLVKLGCHTSETTEAMIEGGRCDYPHGSQLETAERFLHAHGRFVALVTIDIGANDLLACEAAGQIDQACVTDALAELPGNLAEIVSRLRAAAGPDVPIVGMTYYNPLVAAWLQGPQGQQIAQLSTQVVVTLNDVEEAIYGSAGMPVAPVEEAFSTTDFATMVPLPGVGTVPLNVARVCQWTWMCTHGNTHANVTGYAVMADTFEQVVAI